MAKGKNDLSVSEEEIKAQIEEWREDEARRDREFLAEYTAIRELILTGNMTPKEIKDRAAEKSKRGADLLKGLSFHDKLTVIEFNVMVRHESERILRSMGKNQSDPQSYFAEAAIQETYGFYSAVSQLALEDRKVALAIYEIRLAEMMTELLANIGKMLLKVKLSPEEQAEIDKEERKAAMHVIKLKKESQAIMDSNNIQEPE